MEPNVSSVCLAAAPALTFLGNPQCDGKSCVIEGGLQIFSVFVYQVPPRKDTVAFLDVIGALLPALGAVCFARSDLERCP